MVDFTCSSSPSTLTWTFAVRRSDVISTPVTVANAMRGSRSSSLMIMPSSRCNSALTRSARLYAIARLPRLWLDGVRLDDVADLDVVRVERDAALETRGDLAHVVLHTAQRLDVAVMSGFAATKEPRLHTAAHDAIEYAAARDGGLAGSEDLPHLGVADDGLDHHRLEHPGERLLDVVEQLIDDLVHTHVDVGLIGDALRRRFHLRVEADHHRTGGRGEREVGLGDVAHRVVDQLQADLFRRYLREGTLDRLERALHVGLEDELQLLGLALFDLREHLVERRGLVRDARTSALARVRGDERLRGLLVRDGTEHLTGFGHVRQTEDLDRSRWLGAADGFALVVGHRLDAPVAEAGDHEVASLERAGLNEHRRHRAALGVEMRFDDTAASGPVGVGGQFRNVRDKEDGLEQIVEAHLGARRYGDERRVPTVVLDRHPVLRELRLDLIGIRVGLVHLVEGDDDRDARRFHVRDRFDRLRLHAVVGRHNEHRDVGDLRSASPHRGERLVTRCVEEGDLAVLVLDLVGADVLRDATRFARGHVRCADRVEKARLAVVDMAKDRDDGRAWFQLAWVIFDPQIELQRGDLGFGVLDDGRRLFLSGRLDAELRGDQARRVEVDGRVDRRHRAHVHQSAHEVDDADVEKRRELAHGDLLRHDDRRASLDDRHRGRSLLDRWNGRLRALRPTPPWARATLWRESAWSCFWQLRGLLLSYAGCFA